MQVLPRPPVRPRPDLLVPLVADLIRRHARALADLARVIGLDAPRVAHVHLERPAAVAGACGLLAGDERAQVGVVPRVHPAERQHVAHVRHLDALEVAALVEQVERVPGAHAAAREHAQAREHGQLLRVQEPAAVVVDLGPRAQVQLREPGALLAQVDERRDGDVAV